MNALLDKEFLKKLDEHKEKTTYARITALTFDEKPVERIEGTITGGSVNIDGASAVRRTCSLTMTTDKVDINDYYWGIKSKFKLEIGLLNTVDTEQYPEIIWFPQGIYVITGFSTSQNTNNQSISISGKDKMCLLNGDLGGNLPAAINFDVEEYYDFNSQTTIYTKIPIYNIVREALHTYAREPYYNIVINDLDEESVELMEYRGTNPLYLYRDEDGNFINFTTNGNATVYLEKNSESDTVVSNSDAITYLSLNNLLDKNPTTVYSWSQTEEGEDVYTPYTVAKIEYGQTVGYRPTDLTYPGELSSSIGETLTSILDKIKGVLGNYEYFYDTDGRFIFQRVKTYIQTPWTGIVSTEGSVYVNNNAADETIFYAFEDGNLITSFSNNPNLQNLKNDYIIWGQRNGASGAKLPFHYRYAIDIKPIKYTPIDGTQEITIEDVDWREIIYQMALDYNKFSQEDDYPKRLAEKNGQYPFGKTGYEQYYTDLLGFWRLLYNPEGDEEEFVKEDNNKYWSKTIIDHPENLDFWFDFLDADSSLGQFSVQLVGDRTKVVNDTNITAIQFRQVPNLLFVKRINTEGFEEYSKVQVGYGLESLFTISAQGKSAQEKLDELLYNHSYCIESVTISAIPVYYLQPNTRIAIKDQKNKINGEYVISKITIPLQYNGVMSITATKAPERLV